MSRRTRLGQRIPGERGYSLVEMLIVLSILGVVLGGLTTLFVQGSNAELDLNRRFQAQLTARLALDKLRREVHCARLATPTGASASVTLTLPIQCPTTGGLANVSWCAVSVGGATNRYALYRKTGLTCDATGVMWADYLTTSTIFTYTDQSASPPSLAVLHVDLPVNVRPAKTVDSYTLSDDLVLRNSCRKAPGSSCP